MESLWHAQVNREPRARLKGDKRVGVLIIGGGLSGILTAHALKARGVRAVVVEAGEIGSGATGNTTAKITAQHGLIYQRLISERGISAARGYYEINRLAIERFRMLADKHPCDFLEKTAFVFSTGDGRALFREAEAYRALHIEPLIVERPDLPVEARYALGMARQAQFSPLKLLFALAEGLEVYEHSRVLEIDGHYAVFERGRVYADNIVLATHYPIRNIPKLYFAKLYQSRSYVVALGGAQPVNALYIDENENGLSFRDANGFLLVGGGDHRTGYPGGGLASLRAYASEKFPEARIEYAWAVQDVMTPDGVPLIGRYARGEDGLYIATGFNKWGMTGAMAASRVLTDMIAGGSSAYAELFEPTRGMPKKQYVLAGLEAAKAYAAPSLIRCSHMGCALRENAEEGTLDCPCHGSRFTKDGRLLSGPALHDIGPKFTGYYYKHQLFENTLALIPGRSRDGAFLQIITQNDSFIVNYPRCQYSEGTDLRIGDSVFSESGARLNVDVEGLTLEGEIAYGALTPIAYDYMGPFRFFPMECRHKIVSLYHELSGAATLNGRRMSFSGGRGYIEGDSGDSFTHDYAWVQSNDFPFPACVSAAVARVPFLGAAFRGCVAIVFLNGREYRLATYKGARVIRCEPGRIVIRQGDMALLIEASARSAHPLSAPIDGQMVRTIKEAAACSAKFTFSVGEHVLLNHLSWFASCEFVSPQYTPG